MSQMIQHGRESESGPSFKPTPACFSSLCLPRLPGTRCSLADPRVTGKTKADNTSQVRAA